MVAHHVAVVRGEHDDRVLPDSEFVEPLKHLADRVVDHPDHPVGRGDRLAQQGVVPETAGRHPVALVPGMDPREVLEMCGRPVEGIVARRRQGHVRRTVAVEPLARRCHRMVRIGKRAPREPRLPGRFGRLDERDGALGDERGGVEFLRIRRPVDLPPVRGAVAAGCGRVEVDHQVLPAAAPVERPPQVVPGDARTVIDAELDVVETIEVRGVLRGAVEVALRVLDPVPPVRKRQRRGRLATKGHDRVAAHAVLQVGLADEARAVARTLETSHERVHVPFEGAVVEDDAVRARHPSGHHGAPVRHADRVRHPGVLEHHAGSRQPVEVRGLERRVAHEPGVVRALLVRDDEQHVGPFRPPPAS